MAKPAPIEGLDADSPLLEAAHKSLAARLSDVRQYEPKLASSSSGTPDPDDVHDMRVASRRLRAALELFDRRDQLLAAERAVKALGDALGEVRELQVQLTWLDAATANAREADRAGIVALRQARERKLEPKVEALADALGRWPGERAAVEEAVADLEVKGRFGGRRARKRLSERLRDVRKKLRATLASSEARTAHKLRIAVKKLRYVAELCRPAFPEEMDGLLDKLAPLQETLGELHDADVHLPLVEKFLVRADGVAQPGALSLLRAEMARRDRLAAQLSVELQALDEADSLEELRDRIC
jgi:CHAD domain-containing protein